MPPSSVNRRELVSVLPDNINAELALWKQLISDTDMAGEQPPPDDHSNRPYFQAAPPQLPPETYAYLIQALLSLQGSVSQYPQTYPPTYPHQPTLPNFNYPWPPNTAPPISTASVAAPSSFFPTNLPLPQSTASTQLVPSPTASTAQDPDGTEDAASIGDDKRRRNTAASARFRVKKKLRTLSLERTVGDLTGRTEELEREANDLRRENAWLKEIVLLKGRNLAPLNLGLQAPAPANRHDEDERDDRTHAGSELEPTVRSKGKGKDKES